MQAVIDASYFIEAIERSDDAFFDSAVEMSAPSLLPYEVGNVLLWKEKKGTLTETLKASVQVLLGSIAIETCKWSDVYCLAQKHRLTFYDTSYLRLAMDKRAMFATYDRALITAASIEKVPLLQGLC